jgi:hypothetical protein
MVSVASSFSSPFHTLRWGSSVYAHVLSNTCLCLKSDFRLRSVRADVRAGQRVGFGQWAADGICLHHAGMHGVLHLRGIRASIVARVVVMGQCARGTFGSRGGE